MSTEKHLSTILSKTLPTSLRYLHTKIAQEISAIVQYSPTIGLMGKSGVGKSTVCNALFQMPVSPVSDVLRGTQGVLRFTLSLGNHTLTLVDFPGIGESLEWDEHYRALYQRGLPELDLIIWILRADERAWTADEITYRFLIDECGFDPTRFLFVLNQADKIEPCREWDIEQQCPSTTQIHHLQLKTQAVQLMFAPSHPVIAISAIENYHIDELAMQFIHALPANASSATLTQLKPIYRTPQTQQHAKEDFSQCISESLDSLLERLPLTTLLKNTLMQLKDTLVSALTSLWKWVF